LAKKLIEIFNFDKRKEKEIKQGKSNKFILGLLNTCLKEFSVQIISEQKNWKKKDNVFICIPLDNVLEIVKNKIKNQQYNLYDNEGLLVDNQE
jgi:hypothetical protein